MYFITCLTHVDYDKKTLDNLPSARCFGYYANRDTAVERVLQNAMDLHECCYDYAVIEKIDEGIHRVPAEEEIWFQFIPWDIKPEGLFGSDARGRWVEIQKPESTEHVCCFSGVG